MATRPAPDYDQVALGYLVYEFSEKEVAVTDLKIRRSLSRRKLGRFDAERIGRLRQLKNAARTEIDKGAKSAFFRGPHGHYVEMADFDVDGLAADLAAKFPAIPAGRIGEFVPFAILTYYLR